MVCFLSVLSFFKNILKEKGELKVKIKVKLNSKKIGLLDINDKNQFIIGIAVAPENGKANQAIIKILAKEFKVAKWKIKIIKGEKSREKIITVNY